MGRSDNFAIKTSADSMTMKEKSNTGLIVAGVIGAVAVGAILLSGGKAKAANNPKPTPNPDVPVPDPVVRPDVNPVGPQGPVVPGNVPNALCVGGQLPEPQHSAVLKYIKSVNDPNQLDQIAQALQSGANPPGCSVEAAVASTRATNLRNPTYVIQAGDTPSGVAKFYTGDPNRYTELGDVNPDLKAYAVVATTSHTDEGGNSTHDNIATNTYYYKGDLANAGSVLPHGQGPYTGSDGSQVIDEVKSTVSTLYPFNAGQSINLPTAWL